MKEAVAYEKGYHGPDKVENIRIGLIKPMKMLVKCVSRLSFWNQWEGQMNWLKGF